MLIVAQAVTRAYLGRPLVLVRVVEGLRHALMFSPARTDHFPKAECRAALFYGVGLIIHFARPSPASDHVAFADVGQFYMDDAADPWQTHSVLQSSLRRYRL